MHSYKYLDYFKNYNKHNYPGNTLPENEKERLCKYFIEYKNRNKPKFILLYIIILIAVIFLSIDLAQNIYIKAFNNIPILTIAFGICGIVLFITQHRENEVDRLIKQIKSNEFEYMIAPITYSLGYYSRHEEIVMIAGDVPVIPLDDIRDTWVGQMRYVIFMYTENKSYSIPIVYSIPTWQ